MLKNKFFLFYISLCIFFFVKSIIVPWSFFASLSFRMGFFDLGLISSFLSNTAKNKFFYVDQYDVNHLSIHWSPTLTILSPLYSIFESQFLTIFIGNFICSLAICMFLITIYNRFYENEGNIFLKFSISCFTILLIFANKYLNANFLAGHFEIIYTGLSIFYLVSIINNKSIFVTTTLLILAIGVRQDFSLYSFFLILSFFFIPKNIFYFEWKVKKILVMHLSICAIYFILFFKFFSHLVVKNESLYSDYFCNSIGFNLEYFKFFCDNLKDQSAGARGMHFWGYCCKKYRSESKVSFFE